MADTIFRVIQGGNDRPPGMDNIKFMEAYCTDTRLMGVFSIIIRWQAVASDTKMQEDYFQFFRIECEDAGIESFTSLRGFYPKELERIEHLLIKSLGGVRRELSLNEAKMLLRYYSKINKRTGFWPEGRREYNFLLTADDDAAMEDFYTGDLKTYGELTNRNALIHYFLMRMFARDFDAVAHLVASEDVVPDLDSVPKGVLTKDTIKAMDADNDTFRVTSLVETKSGYSMVLSEVTVKNGEDVSDCRILSSFDISATEAALQLAKSEFVTVYDCDISQEKFADIAIDTLVKSVPSLYESGRLYMYYHPHNNHINADVYMLNNDVKGMLFLSNNGELIAASNTREGIHAMENEIRGIRELTRHAIATAKYEFNEPIVYDYILSDYPSFEEFINDIQDPEE